MIVLLYKKSPRVGRVPISLAIKIAKFLDTFYEKNDF